MIPAPQVYRDILQAHLPTAFAETDTSTPTSRPALNVTIHAIDAQEPLPTNAPHATPWLRGLFQEQPATA